MTKKLTAKDISLLIREIKDYSDTFSQGDAEILWVFNMINNGKLTVKDGASIAVNHCVFGNKSDASTTLRCHLSLGNIENGLKKEMVTPFRNEVVIQLKRHLTKQGLQSIEDYLNDIKVAAN